jgi:hypothetical protein
MPLDEATRRFSFLLQGDLRRLTSVREEQAARGEEIKFDSVSRIAIVETRRGEAVARLHGEILATYTPYDRILRWAWAGRSPSAPLTHGDVVFREGQARGVPQLAMSVVGDLSEEDAATLVKLGALVARAEGLHDRKVGPDTEFIGLFDRSRPAENTDATENRFSVPPPPAADKSQPPGPPPRAYRSIPPIREIFEPRTHGSRPPVVPAGGSTSWSNLGAAGASPSTPPSAAVTPPAGTSSSQMPVAKKLREPSRALFLPVANAALAALARGSKGYLQGLFVLTLDTEGRGTEPRRLMVQLVVVDTAGILRALDPPADVIEAAASMVAADRREGNGSWRKLSARITPKANGGATLHVDVS